MGARRRPRALRGDARHLAARRPPESRAQRGGVRVLDDHGEGSGSTKGRARVQQQGRRDGARELSRLLHDERAVERGTVRRVLADARAGERRRSAGDHRRGGDSDSADRTAGALHAFGGGSRRAPRCADRRRGDGGERERRDARGAARRRLRRALRRQRRQRQRRPVDADRRGLSLAGDVSQRGPLAGALAGSEGPRRRSLRVSELAGAELRRERSSR